MFSIALPVQFPWLTLILILMFVALIATFVSHTVAALILLPIFTTVGVSIGGAEIVVIASAYASKFNCDVEVVGVCHSKYSVIMY